MSVISKNFKDAEIYNDILRACKKPHKPLKFEHWVDIDDYIISYYGGSMGQVRIDIEKAIYKKQSKLVRRF